MKNPAPRPVLARILESPHLAIVVPRLHPGVLHRVIDRFGLEDCAELVALATPKQLARVFDLDLWRAAQPGLDERFDAERFGLWLEVLVESGVDVAAEKLAGMDVDLLIAGFAQHVAGCSIQARAFTIQEASDAAAAVCNLGLENWPSSWLPAGSGAAPAANTLPGNFLFGHDLVSVFQVGWAVLYRDVAMSTAERLIGVLSRLRCADREIQSGLGALRIELIRHSRAGAPWLAREALEVMAMLDLPAWAALLGLIDECPVMHGAVGALSDARTRTISPSAFEFIAENSQLASIAAFMESLPDVLS
jgi:hypothetical protein